MKWKRMRRAVASALALVMALSCSVGALAVTNFTLTPSVVGSGGTSVEVPSGGTFTVEVKASATESEITGIDALQFDLEYDSSLVEYVSSNTEGLIGIALTNNIAATDGGNDKVRLVYVNSDLNPDTIIPEVVMSVTFRMLVDPNGAFSPATCFSISGIEAYVTGEGDTITGVTTATGTAEGEVTVGDREFLLGDVNGDELANARDAMQILQKVVGIREFSAIQELAGDVNGDGISNARDSLKILQFVVGIISNF